MTGRNLKRSATRHAELLTGRESNFVISNAYLVEEFPAPVSNSYVEVLRRNHDAMQRRGWGAPPPEVGGRHTVNSASAHGYTYLLRFGQRDVWKVGRASDPVARLSEINKYVPSEVLGESWELVKQLQLPSEESWSRKYYVDLATVESKAPESAFCARKKM